MKTMLKTTVQVLLMLTLPSGLVVFGQAAEPVTVASNATTTFLIHNAPAPPVNGASYNAVTATIKPPAGSSSRLQQAQMYTSGAGALPSARGQEAVRLLKKETLYESL